ncbi:MAG: class I SAM-dependent methyltransferase [Verrucomicrobiota bacterium]
MARVEGDLWWYRALHQQVADALDACPSRFATRIVDAGCGTGGLLLFLQHQGYRYMQGCDISPEAVRICRQRGLPVEQRDLRELGQFWPGTKAEALISTDTLYFFSREEQMTVIRQLHEALSPGGLLIMNLPALAAFRGAHDRCVGIQQRFTRRDVIRLFPPSRFERVQARFWPCLVSPGIFMARAWQRLRLRCLPDQEAQSDLDLPPSWLNRWLERVTRLENAWFPWKPFGSSLFVTAQKLSKCVSINPTVKPSNLP